MSKPTDHPFLMSFIRSCYTTDEIGMVNLRFRAAIRLCDGRVYEVRAIPPDLMEYVTPCAEDHEDLPLYQSLPCSPMS